MASTNSASLISAPGNVGDSTKSVPMEVLLSFNYDDCHLAEALRATLFMLEPNLDVMEIILSPACYGGVHFEENIARGIEEADRFLIVVGPHGVGKRQEIECKLAFARKCRERDFIVLPVLAAEGRRPTTEMLRDLNWIEMPVVTDRRAARWLIKALNGGE
jgi:TIR domain